MSTDRKLIDSSDLRGVLLATIEGVLEGRVAVNQANAVVGLSGELHKSIRQEWEMRCYANQNMRIISGEIVKEIEDGNSKN